MILVLGVMDALYRDFEKAGLSDCLRPRRQVVAEHLVIITLVVLLMVLAVAIGVKQGPKHPGAPAEATTPTEKPQSI